MAENEKRYTLVEGTPDEHADAIAKAYKRVAQGSANREWVLFGLIILYVIGHAIYSYVYP